LTIREPRRCGTYRAPPVTDEASPATPGIDSAT
jgi:hypothetical protein